MQLAYIILLRTGYNNPCSVTKTFPHVTYHLYSKNAVLSFKENLSSG